MTKFDDMIKAELEKEASEIDELLAADGGLPDMVAATFKGSMRRWVWLIWAITLLVSVLMFWCGYQFFTGANLQEQTFWGFCTMMSMAAQVALKQWSWMEMNRASTMREIKRLELAVASLSRKVRDN